MTWEDDYKLSVLRAVGLTVEEIKRVDMSTVVLTVTDYDGSDSYHSGCDTCGSWPGSAGWIKIEVRYFIADAQTGKLLYCEFYYDTPSEVADFFRKVMSP